MSDSDWTVFKIGGSLLNWPHLSTQLQSLLDQCAARPIVLIVGGGAVADAVRDWDRTHPLGFVSSHTLAVRSMSLTARLLAELLPGCQLVDSLGNLARPTQNAGTQHWILDVSHDVLSAPGRAALPASWDVTSDAIAAWVAARISAAQLVYVKSVAAPEPFTWEQAAARGLIDPSTPPLIHELPPHTRCGWINLRTETEIRWDSPPVRFSHSQRH